MILAHLVLLAQVGLGGQAGLNGYPFNAPTISGTSVICDATTCVLQWTTSVASDSRGSCGTEQAVDNATQGLVTSHEIVVAGLVASTGYTCTMTSGATSATIAATTAAAAATTPITGVSIGSPTAYNSTSPPNQFNADTYSNCVSSDGTTYFVLDDITGQGASGAQSSAISLAKFTSTGTPLVAANVNGLSGYGACCTTATPDGYSPKSEGIFCMNGTIFMSFTRQKEQGASFNIQYAQQFIQSNNHGTTWNNYQNPATFTANGAEMSPVTLTTFTANSPTNFASGSFVIYGADDGTNGYLVANNRVDNANAYVYFITNGQTAGGSTWNNGDNYYLIRCPRAKLAGNNPNAWQYFVSGDGSLDSNWTNSPGSAGVILNNAAKLSVPSIQYIPALNRYLLSDFYYPSFSNTANSVALFYEAPHPWGPWTLVTTVTNTSTGYYGYYVLQPDALAATLPTVTMRILFTGNFNGGTSTYAMNYATLTVSH